MSETDTTPVIVEMPTLAPAKQPDIFDPQGLTASDIIQAGLDAGVHPRLIRRKMASLGVRWSYSWPRHQGVGERERRVRQMTRKVSS